MTDLELATLEDLWGEIRRRCDGAILGVVFKRSDGVEDSSLFFEGGLYQALGLCATIHDRLLELRRQIHDDSDSECDD